MYLAELPAKDDSERLSGNVTSIGTNQYTERRLSLQNARVTEQRLRTNGTVLVFLTG